MYTAVSRLWRKAVVAATIGPIPPWRVVKIFLPAHPGSVGAWTIYKGKEGPYRLRKGIACDSP